MSIAVCRQQLWLTRFWRQNMMLPVSSSIASILPSLSSLPLPLYCRQMPWRRRPRPAAPWTNMSWKAQIVQSCFKIWENSSLLRWVQLLPNATLTNTQGATCKVEWSQSSCKTPLAIFPSKSQEFKCGINLTSSGLRCLILNECCPSLVLWPQAMASLSARPKSDVIILLAKRTKSSSSQPYRSVSINACCLSTLHVCIKARIAECLLSLVLFCYWFRFCPVLSDSLHCIFLAMGPPTCTAEGHFLEYNVWDVTLWCSSSTTACKKTIAVSKHPVCLQWRTPPRMHLKFWRSSPYLTTGQTSISNISATLTSACLHQRQSCP